MSLSKTHYALLRTGSTADMTEHLLTGKESKQPNRYAKSLRLTLCLLAMTFAISADNICKQLGPRSGPTIVIQTI